MVNAHAAAVNDAETTGVAAIESEWKLQPPARALPAGRIDLWAVELAELHRHRELLSAEELASGARRRNKTQREMAIAGRIGLRIFLQTYTGIANHELHIAAGARGKPSLRNKLRGGELCFNYSLSGGRALFAFAWNRMLGVDLEVSPRRINAEVLAKRKLNAREQCAWRNMPAALRDTAMLACWTRKEAYGKALGVGIRYFLNQSRVCECFDSPRWSCGVRGMFDAREPKYLWPRELHGLQISPPFPAVAALVHDGDALGHEKHLQCRRLRVDSLLS